MHGDPSHWFKQTAARWSQHFALIRGGETISFSALHDLATRWGHKLRRDQPAADQGLVISTKSRSQLAWMAYASLRAGVPLLPLDPKLPESLRERLLRSATRCERTGEVARHLQSSGRAWAPLGIDTSRSALQWVLFTSGSTGAPKGVYLSPTNLAASVQASQARIPLYPGDCWLHCLSLYHIGGLAILCRCLAAGATLLLQERFQAQAVWDALWRHSVTHLSLVPTLLARLLALSGDQPPPPSLRVLLVGGAPLNPSLARRALAARWPLCVTYGMTETGSQVATRCGPEAGLAAGRVGKPLPGFQVRIGEPDEQGVGRIWVRGPALMLGYANPQGRLGLGLKGGWLDTGDLGCWEKDGALRISGRADDVLISGGEKVHPQLVEAQLTQCAGVEEAALSACPDPHWGERLVLLYRGDAAPERLAAYAKRHLQGAWRPKVFYRVDQLPRNAMGKLDRRALRAWVKALEN